MNKFGFFQDARCNLEGAAMRKATKAVQWDDGFKEFSWTQESSAASFD